MTSPGDTATLGIARVRQDVARQDLGYGYGQTESLMDMLEEASRLLNAYARAILASGS